MFNIVDLIKILTHSRSIHVCIQPICPDKYTVDLPYELFTHSKSFCDLAKMTDAGLDACYKNKDKAIEKALKGQCFSGYCSCGLYEYVKPVYINAKIKYIIYLGNILKDKKKAEKNITKLCQKTLVDGNKLKEELLNAERFCSDDEYQKIIEIVEHHLKRFHEKNKRNQKDNGNYIVNLLRDFVKKNYNKNFSISAFAKTHKVNAKYLGRLYKNQEGVTVTEYINSIRLEKALYLIKNTDKKIIEIAFSVGFSNIGYFNRAFKTKYGLSPREFRK